MTQFSDDLFLGGASFGANQGSGSSSYGFPNNGFGRTGGLPYAYGGIGIGPMGRIFYYDVVPLAVNAANIAASQTPGSSALVLSAGTGTTAVVDAYGVTRIQLDCARCVTVTSGGNDTGITFLIKGYDIYEQPMSQLLTGASGAAATTTKAFYQIVSITPSGAVATTAEAGTADIFGLPVALTNGVYMTQAKWGTAVTALGNDTGTLVLAVTTSPATTTTGDVRGTYAPSSSSDGTKRLVISQICPGSQAGPSATAANVIGVQQV
jgi:hypothetical protein